MHGERRERLNGHTRNFILENSVKSVRLRRFWLSSDNGNYRVHFCTPKWMGEELRAGEFPAIQKGQVVAKGPECLRRSSPSSHFEGPRSS
jgi:hypothetical protein